MVAVLLPPVATGNYIVFPKLLRAERFLLLGVEVVEDIHLSIKADQLAWRGGIDAKWLKRGATWREEHKDMSWSEEDPCSIAWTSAVNVADTGSLQGSGHVSS